jgi:hypothetical protein
MSQNHELFEAIDQGQRDQVRALLASGVSAGCRDAAGIPALMRAIEAAQPEVVAELLNAGADPNGGRPLSAAERKHRDKKDRVETPLSLATLQGNVRAIELLLEAGASLEGSGCSTAACMNMIYSGEQEFAAVERLLDAGLDPKCKWKGTTLAALAARNEHQRILDKIAELGVRVTAPRSPAPKKPPRAAGRSAGDFLAFVHDWGHPEWLVLAVEAPLEQTSTVYSELRAAKRQFLNVPVRAAGDRDDEIAPLIALVQPEGCAWTLLYQHLCVPITRRDIQQGETVARSLSGRLGTRALAFFGEDTSYSMSISHFERGEACGTRNWGSQTDTADPTFAELDLYLPPCYPREHDGQVWLCALEGAAARIHSAHVLDLGGE